jgi:hypothetical protein
MFDLLRFRRLLRLLGVLGAGLLPLGEEKSFLNKSLANDIVSSEVREVKYHVSVENGSLRRTITKYDFIRTGRWLMGGAYDFLLQGLRDFVGSCLSRAEREGIHVIE